jgi:hypothetical protein
MSKYELAFVIARSCNYGLQDNINSKSEINIIGPVRTNVQRSNMLLCIRNAMHFVKFPKINSPVLI